MLIVCPHCGTSYRIAAESLGETGRSVRCVSCLSVWFEAPHPRIPAEAETMMQSAPAQAPQPALIRPPLDDVVPVGGDLSAAPPSQAAEWGRAAVEQELYPEDSPAARLPDAESPPIAPLRGEPAAAGPAGGHAESGHDVESFAALVARQRRARRQIRFSGPGLPAAICALVLVLLCLVAARQQVVRFLPQTASLYARVGLPVNLRGLQFAAIKTVREMQDGVPVLVVEGEIVGTSARLTEVPRLRLAVVNAEGREIYAWTARPSRSVLPPGETLAFRSRLASPPAEASGVTVRFFNRRDAQSGLM
jgi:predicted Zn finger-like uncharacterized protein